MRKVYVLAGAIIIIFLVMICSLIPENPLYQVNWALLSTFIIILGVLMCFWRFETHVSDAKHITLIGTLSSLAAISRVVFAGIVNVQPATFIIMISGYVFGAQTGFMVGAITALVSNFFIGQGPWTPWQMLAWGLCGVIGAFLGKRQSSNFAFLSFVILSGLCGYLFGIIMNIWHWVGFVYPLNMNTFLATYAASFVFDSMHAVSNIAFALVFGKGFYTILMRFKKYI